MISKTMRPTTIIPTFAPKLRPDESADAPAVEVATEAVVIATWVEVKTVPLRPMTMPVPGCWLQPACSAIITRGKLVRSRDIPYLGTKQ